LGRESVSDMPTMHRWIDHEYKRLRAEGKGALVDLFEPFRKAYFSSNYEVVLQTLPDLYNIADMFREQNWWAVISYYEASIAINWQGDLARGLDLAMRALIHTHTGNRSSTVPMLYTREMVLGAWLNVDGRGYAADVLANLDEIAISTLPTDIAVRMKLIKARALAELDDVPEAVATQLEALPDLDWPEPYHIMLKAQTLTWQQRHAESLVLYNNARRIFGEFGMRIESNDMRISAGATLTELNRIDEALEVLEEAMMATEQTVNRAQMGIALGLLGEAFLKNGQANEAAGCCSTALDLLDGLGWLRTEAEYALTYLDALEHKGKRSGDTWVQAFEDAQRRVYSLRSTDLHHRLDRLISSEAD